MNTSYKYQQGPLLSKINTPDDLRKLKKNQLKQVSDELRQYIIDIVSEATGLTKVETEAVMNGVMKTIIDSLASNNRVELRGFGTFSVKHRMPKKARNPGTGDAIYLPERFVPTFKPSKIMRSRVNELTKK